MNTIEEPIKVKHMKQIIRNTKLSNKINKKYKSESYDLLYKEDDYIYLYQLKDNVNDYLILCPGFEASNYYKGIKANAKIMEIL